MNIFHSTMVFPFMLHYLAFIFPFRKVRNLQIGVENLIGKVSINTSHKVSHHAKSASIISIIINVSGFGFYM